MKENNQSLDTLHQKGVRFQYFFEKQQAEHGRSQQLCSVYSREQAKNASNWEWTSRLKIDATNGK